MSLFRKEDYLLLKDIIVASYVAACRHYVNISIMQEELRLKDCSYAKNIMNQLEDFAVIGPADESGYNKALITQVEWQQIASKYVDKKLLYAKSKYSLSYIDGLPGHEFEHYCADLLVKRGFQKASVTPASGDQGVDILAEKDGIKYAIQCKCYASDLGNTPIQEVESGKTFYGCHVGAVMTNRYFTAGAKKLAEKTGTLLWDRDALHEMMNHVLKMENAH